MELVYFVLVFILIAVVGYISDLVIKDFRERNSAKNQQKTQDLYRYLREIDEDFDDEQPKPVHFQTPAGALKIPKIWESSEDELVHESSLAKKQESINLTMQPMWIKKILNKGEGEILRKLAEQYKSKNPTQSQ